jgi:hypothetical protein
MTYAIARTRPTAKRAECSSTTTVDWRSLQTRRYATPASAEVLTKGDGIDVEDDERQNVVILGSGWAGLSP